MKDLSITVLLIVILIHLTTPWEVQAQEGEKITFSHITVADGLSHHEVSFILQDAQGFMWFGTKYGLNKYDGLKMTVFTHDPEDPNSLDGDFVWWIHQAVDGTLWIPTWGGGVSRLDPQTGLFTNYHHDVNDPHSIGGDLVWSVYEDRKGHIWSAPDSGGLNKFKPETETWFRYRHDPNDPHSVSHDSVSVMCEDHQGMLWVATYGGGLNRFDPEKGLFTRYQHDQNDPDSLSDNNLWAVYIDSHAQIWVGSEKGLNKFDPDTGKSVRYQHDAQDPNSLSFDTVSTIYEDRKGRLWVGTFGGGLNRFDPQSERFIRYQHDSRDPHSLMNNTVTSVFEDATGTLWVSSYGGVDKYDPGSNRFAHFDHHVNDPESLSNNTVRSIHQDGNGVGWIGTEGGGLNRLNSARNAFVHYTHDNSDPASISGNDILAIGTDKRGELWIGTNGAGLNRFNPVQGKSVCYRHDPIDPNTLGSDTIYDLVVDRQGDVVWIAAYMNGLDKYDITRKEFTHYTFDETNPNSPRSNWITTLCLDSKGKIWIGGEPGLSHFDPVTEVFTNYQHDRNNIKSVSSDLVYTIHAHSRGGIWIGTNNGLNRYEASTGTFLHYYERDGLAGNRVVAIEEDARGHLWISTDKGLSHFDPQNKTFHNYDQRDGLQGNRFSVNASYKNAAGELFFGGTNGFNVFHPRRLMDNPHVPNVVLTDFQLFNQPVRVGQDSPLRQPINHARHISLAYDQSVFSIEFAALNFRHALKNQYAYMMEGFDSDFMYTDSDDRSVTYTNLDPGQYVFQVKASNNDGLWNEQGASLAITIVPPWWKTVWFNVVIGVILIGISLSIVLYLNKLHSEVEYRKLMHKSLEESEGQIRLLLENMGDMISEHDPDSTITYVSPSCESLLGYRADELLNQRSGEFVLPEDREPTIAIISDAVERHASHYRLQHRLRCQNGDYVWVETVGRLVYDTEGKLSKIQCNGRDITERKKLSATLIENEEKFSTAFHSNASIMAFSSIEEGRFSDVNENFLTVLGFERNEVIGKTSKELNLVSDIRQREMIKQVVEEKGHARDIEVGIRTKSGKIRTGLFSAAVVQLRHQACWLTVFHDITERKQMEEELARHREHLEDLVKQRTIELETANRQLGEEIGVRKRAEDTLTRQQVFLEATLENTEDGIVACDEKGNLTLFNRATREMHGIDQEELPPEQWASHYDLYHSDGTSLMKTEDIPLYRAFQGERLAKVEMIIAPKNAQKHDILVSGQPLTDEDGTKIGAVISLHEITEQKRVESQLLSAKEDAERASKAKSEFLANMSHELRTPLNAIIGFSEILESLITNDKQYGYLSRIQISGRALLTLINDILDLSKIEAGRLDLCYGPVSPPVLLAETAHLFTHKLMEKNIDLDIDTAPDLPVALLLDKARLRQILLNLVGNALKFTAQGSVTIRCWAQYDDETSGRLDFCLSVTDTGIGIPTDQQDVIFSPFVQQKGTETARYGGTGLGLTITKRLVEAMGGTITVESRVGEGSTFTVVVSDVKVAPADALALQREAPFNADTVSFVRATVLIVDDIDYNRDLLKGFYSGFDLEIIEAENGKEAVDLARQYRPELILLDMKMPVMDGYEAAALLKADAQLHAIPVVAVTASALKQDETRIRKVCDGYLRKPVSRAELIRETMTFLKHTVHERAEGSESSGQALTDVQAGIRIGDLPADLVESLHRALVIGDIDDLAELVEQVKVRDEDLAIVLGDYLDRYEHGRLLDIFTP